MHHECDYSLLDFYRSQGKFSEASVILFTGGGVYDVTSGLLPPGSRWPPPHSWSPCSGPPGRNMGTERKGHHTSWKEHDTRQEVTLIIEDITNYEHSFDCPIIYAETYNRPQRSCGKVIFSQTSFSHSVHGGGMHGMGGMHDRGHAWQGACMPACPPWADTVNTVNEIRSMSGRYASYVNAFLSTMLFCSQTPQQCLI